VSLTANVQARYSSQILINASNPQNSTATTLDSTRLGYACTDVEAEFSKRGMTYDDTDAKHVATAVPGVLARLLVMTGGEGGKEAWNDFKDDVKFLAETDSRDRIMPYTNSPLDPTPDPTGAKPFSDNDNFKRYIPGSGDGAPNLD
jgi:hypothetical protein